MKRHPLTAKQRLFLEYLIQRVSQTGVWPTYQELVEYFGFRSPNSVTQNLRALIKKGYLKRDALGYRFTDDTLLRPKEAGIPIRGIITAGALQEAVEAPLGTLSLETLFPELPRIFALRVEGNSMIEAGIHDGDYVLLVQEELRDGDIGAVCYRGETTLKRIYREGPRIRLEPANAAYEAILLEPGEAEEVRVLGKYVGHVNEQGIFRAR